MARTRRRAEPSRIAALAAVTALHGVALLALLLAFAPGAALRTQASILSAITVVPPPPSPPPARRPPLAPPANMPAPGRSVAAPAPHAAVSRHDAPLTPPITLATATAPPTGAGGSGNGAGAARSGTGSGGDGSAPAGDGGGTASEPVKVAGHIDLASDYPPESRSQRIGDYVIIAITVGTEGTPSACRVIRPSRDEAANDITCRLAMARFRFSPARDRAGRAVEGVYGWKQMWFMR